MPKLNVKLVIVVGIMPYDDYIYFDKIFERIHTNKI